MVNEFKAMTLGVFAHKKFWIDSEGVKTTGGFGRQIEECAHYFHKTILVVPCRSRDSLRSGYQVSMPKMEIIPLPYFDGTGFLRKLDFLLKGPWIAWRLWKNYNRCDLIHYRIPGYIGILGLLIHKLRGSKPGFVWLGTNWPERIRQTGKETWYRRLMSHIAARSLPWLINEIPTFALGDIAVHFERTHPYAHPTISTILSKSDIAKDNSTDFDSPARVLFVGRIGQEKGLVYLIEALSLCTDMGLNLDLTVVGEGAQKEKIANIAKKYGLEDRIHFAGYVPLGEHLWQFYRMADFFVLPSLSEGQGKVLIEAMACGLPVIATRVGGIPTIIEDGYTGLLVAPHSSQAITDAIERLINDPNLRQFLAQNELISAQKYTIEEQTELLMRQLAIDLRSLGWAIGK